MANTRASKKTTETRKVVKKTPAKTPSRTTVSESVKTSSPSETPKRTLPSFASLQVKRSYLITLAVVLLVAAALYAGKSLFVAAVVNGQPISRLSIVKELEKQGGKQALQTQVTKTLILQEANKKKVTVPQSEIDAELKKIQTNLSQQGQTLEQALTGAGMTKASLEDQIRLQKLLEKMVGSNATVSDAEINEYIETNKESIPADQDPEETKTQVKQQLQQSKLNEKVQAFVQELQKNAKINFWVSY